ncbi:MAG: hypothetical protein J5645_09920 [Lachnospiraceae bacterium]|nr:hypothetical protein [Lachnospiraceae bacterium]
MKDARKEYADIIDREHHVSRHRRPMPRSARAAQFSPFAALTGYDDLVAESARLTDARIQLTEEQKVSVNEVLTWIMKQPTPAEATFTYFVPDRAKAGGSYETVSGTIKKHDALAHTLLLSDGRTIPIENLCEVNCAEYDRNPEQE